MKYRYLGATGLKISEISFGTQTFGWTTDEDTAFHQLDYYINQGGNYLDTADSYNDGASEEILGKWLRMHPESKQLIIGAKVYFNDTGSEGSNAKGHSRKHIMQSIENTLTRLGREAIDLYQLHCYDRGTDVESVMETMQLLVQQGKILHYGLSNFDSSTIMKMSMIGANRGLARPVSLQLEYSLLVRSPEWELLPICTECSLGTLAWSPLGGGWLTGKYQRNASPPPNSRVGRKDRDYDQPDKRVGEKTWAIIDALTTVAHERGVPASEVAINWLRKKKTVSSVLIGARTMEQLAENMASLQWDISDEEEKFLDNVSDIPLPYPYNFIEMYSRASYK